MGQLALTYTLTAGTPENVNQVQQNFSDIVTWANSNNFDQDNIASGFLDKVGVNSTGVSRRGYQAVLTEQATATTTASDLSTVGPSISVTVPANGLVRIFVAVDMKVTVATSDAYVFIYEATDLATPLQVAFSSGNTTYATRYSLPGSTSGTTTFGLSGALTNPGTTGNRTYVVKYAKSVAGTGSASFQNRRLWVITEGY